MTGTPCNLRDYRKGRNQKIIDEYNQIAKRNPEMYQRDIIQLIKKRLKLDIKERQIIRILSNNL
jgi:hypothetical protein